MGHIWMEHGEHGGRAQLPDIPYWRAAGWEPCDGPPPEPDLTRDPEPEVFIPRYGDEARSTQILDQAATWYEGNKTTEAPEIPGPSAVQTDDETPDIEEH